ncbi:MULTISPECIES: hypothetical protein [Enterobacter]|uniref:hypothetical protein n=1 Tax=Enterobacter TaxID=547 RepID=UPI0007E516E7|nr:MULTISPECIES: hypothetical protein [Enterobacter]MCS3488135.1 hypothetical protein [Enterobacter sp. SLBN-59]OAY17819.1 hypothetical protein AXY04_13335 [Enterobacter asburiae]SHI09783.1 hypothetical protein SAMN05428958_1167 [Pantoea sesami]
MGKFSITSIRDIDWQSDPSRPGNCNITVGLNTPAGYTSISFDPGSIDIKKSTIEDLEKLAIEEYQKRMN